MHKIKASQKEKEEAATWDIWKKEVSQFPWKYPSNERCLILKGSATVTDTEGNEIHFQEGDLVYFPKGLECHWKIHSDIEKRYVLF
jgi:hypothetical protein